MVADTRREIDALELLMEDHRKVELLFSECAHLQSSGRNTTSVMQSICAELKIHDALENDIFYPAVSHASGAEDVEALLDDAEDAHDSVLDLVDELEEMDVDTPKRHARIALLAERVRTHVMAEESELFPKVRALDRLNLQSLAIEMKSRKSELTGNVGVPEFSEESA